MLVIKSKVSAIVHANGKRMSKSAWEALDSRINAMIQGACKLCGGHSTVRDTEIFMSGSTTTQPKDQSLADYAGVRRK